MTFRVRTRGLGLAISQAEMQIQLEANTALRETTTEAFDAVRAATPIDTGTAQRSWRADYFGAPSINNGGIDLPPLPVTRAFITNGVDYIDELNRGTSVQAPSRFIESNVLRFFDRATGTIVRRV